MQGPHLTEGVCRALLNALLSPAEREAVVSHIAACPACEKLFKEKAIERENLRAAIALRFGPDGKVIFDRLHERIGSESAEVDGIAPDEIPNDQTEIVQTEAREIRGQLSGTLAGLWIKLRAGLRRPRYGFGLGLTAAAILLVLVWPQEQGAPNAALRWLPISAAGASVRASVEAISNQDLAAGLDAYAARDLDRAIRVLQTTEATGQQEAARRIFLANALAWNGEHADAVSILRTVDAWTLPDPWGSEARWTLYVSLRECGQEAAADSLLRVLAQERGEVGDRARRAGRGRAE